MGTFEGALAVKPTTMICGIDEVGRGCLAGPIVAVAALFKGWEPGVPGVDDSKKLKPAVRRKLLKMLCRSPFLVDFGIGIGTVDEINDAGIDHANMIAFSRAVESLPLRPNWIVVDGMKGVPGWHQNQEVVPKADGLYPVVGAASIIAKVIRDDMMAELGQIYPEYKWWSNAGYGSKDHREALKAIGPCAHHRKKFISKIVSPQTAWSL